jgi:hypothetical protein
VLLFAGKSVIGTKNPMTIRTSGTPQTPEYATEYQLELQSPFTSIIGGTISSPVNQVFRLDGDSIILEGTHSASGALRTPCLNTDNYICPSGPPPQLVFQVQNARGVNGSPIVAGLRNLSDNEFWDFVPLPGSPPYPTTGFQAVATEYELWNALCAVPKARKGDRIYPPVTDDGTPIYTCFTANPGWGTVIEISSPKDCAPVPGPLNGQTQDIGGCLDLSGYPPLNLPAGVTLRGNRRGTLSGPQLYFSFVEGQILNPNLQRSPSCSDATCMIEVHGDYVRLTGLRLRGESHSVDDKKGVEKQTAIHVFFPGSSASWPGPAPLPDLRTATHFIATIDHNEGFDWTESPVEAQPIFNYEASDDPNKAHGESNKCAYDAFGRGKNYTCDENVQTELVPYPQAKSSTGEFTYVLPIPLPMGCTTKALPPEALNGACLYANDPGTLANIRIARNFLHHNMRDGAGYGASVRGRALIERNTFDWNRHDISADAEPHNEYRASHNLALSGAWDHYGKAGIDGRLQDFDMHGTAWADTPGFEGLLIGGAAGYYVEIDGNTFLGSTGLDYRLRGYPVIPSYYHNNVSVRKEGDALEWDHCFSSIFGLFGCAAHYSDSDFQTHVTVSSDNRFAITYPTARLAVGDFDGDGQDDLFLATGNTWFYSPGGQREWRYLNSAPDTIDQLLFGDFDGDGRTDVVAMRNGHLVISWGGISAFDPLNADALPCALMSDAAVGDFDGDGKPDIFCADGRNWHISSGGTALFHITAGSTLRGSDVRFGHFATCGAGRETDVFSAQSSGWYVSCGASSGWRRLPVSLTNTIAGLVVADFDGEGFADVMSSSADGWRISFGGTQGWKDIPQDLGGFSAFANLAGIGHFTGQRQADVLGWMPFTTQLWLSAAAVSPPTAYSTQDMR